MEPAGGRSVFTGREEELDALDDVLASTDHAVITQAITGLGGVGKSQLAARYVQKYGGRYNVVAWVRAEDGATADLADLATKLDLRVEGRSPSDRAQLAVDWLGETDQSWLLVLDNIGSIEQLEGLVPRIGRGWVLVTSRDQACASSDLCSWSTFSMKTPRPSTSQNARDALVTSAPRASLPARWAACRSRSRTQLRTAQVAPALLPTTNC
jgi:hypothetical protein